MEFAPPFLVLVAVIVGVAYAQSRKLRSGLVYVMKRDGHYSLGSPEDEAKTRLIGR